MRGRLTSTLWYAAGFATAAALFALLLAWGGVYPFGPESFLTEDLKYQYIEYIDFFTWYRSVLFGEESLFYTFGTSLGSDTWALFSYYLASPFNLLVVFFDEQHLTEKYEKAKAQLLSGDSAADIEKLVNRLTAMLNKMTSVLVICAVSDANCE